MWRWYLRTQKSNWLPNEWMCQWFTSLPTTAQCLPQKALFPPPAVKYFLLLFIETGFLCGPGCPGAKAVNQSGLNFKDPPAYLPSECWD